MSSSPALPTLVDLPAGFLPRPDECSPADKTSLVAALATVVDGRSPQGLRHPLLPIVVLAVWAVMGGAASFAAIADAAIDAEADLVEVIGLRHPRWGLPHAATIRRALILLDVPSLETALRRWAIGRRLALLAERSAPPGRALAPAGTQRAVFALDGKTARGSIDVVTDADGHTCERQVAMVSVLDVACGLVLTQTPIVEGNEVAAAATVVADLAGCMDLTGVVVTADARHTVRSTAALLLEHGAHYLLRVKANTPTLWELLRRQDWAHIGGQIEDDRAHHRRESRSIKVMNLTPGQLAVVQDIFPGAVQLIKIVRRRKALDGTRTKGRRKIKTTVEIVYYVTSLTFTQASPTLLATWIRQHWHIENRVHHVRDVTLREDASRVRIGGGPQVMAALRNTVINLARLTGAVNIAARTRRWSRRGHEALTILLTA